MNGLAGVCVVALIVTGGSVSAEESVAPNGFFFNVDINLAADGSGTLRLSYPSNPVMNPETERERFKSAVTQMKEVEFNGQMVRTTVTFTDLTRVAEAPELRSITAKRESLGDGRERVEARLKSYFILDAKTEAPLTITVNFPGSIVEANTKEIKGTTATWRPPAKDFFKESGIQLEAVYRPNGAGAAAAVRPN